MANQEHVEILRKGVVTWNEWLRKNPDISPDLSEADLSWMNLSRANFSGADLREAQLHLTNLVHADLIGVNLVGANLREANLSGADLSGAELKGVNLREAVLYSADLSGAILRRADLSEAKLINAFLSEADISGAHLEDANISRWKIEGIKCAHVFRNGKRIDYAEGEFEKKHTQIEGIIEIILDAPFSDLTQYLGKIIERLSNDKHDGNTILFKGQEALSDSNTQLKFLSFADSEKLDEIQRKIEALPEKINPFIQEVFASNEPKSPIGIKDEVDFFKALVVRPKEIQRVLNERYMTMGPLLQKVVQAIQESLK